VSVTTVTCNGDSEERKSSPSTKTNAEMPLLSYHHDGPSSLLPSRTQSPELERHLNIEEKGDLVEEPAIAVQNSSPTEASNEYPASPPPPSPSPPPPKSAATLPPKRAATPPPPSTKPPPQKKAKIKAAVDSRSIVPRRTSNPRSFEDPFDGLSNLAKRFLATMKIATAEKLLSIETADIAVNFVDWRIKEDMLELKERGANATVSGWKGQVRKFAEEMGLQDRDGSEIVLDVDSSEVRAKRPPRKSKRSASLEASRRLASTEASRIEAATEESRILAATEASRRLAVKEASQEARRVDRPDEILPSEGTVTLKPPDAKKSTKKSSTPRLGMNDVVCNKGGGRRNHIGNRMYLEMLEEKATLWRKSPTYEGSVRLAEEIIASIAGKTPPGRFLRVIPENKFELADDRFIRDKVRQGIKEWFRYRKSDEEKNGVYGCKVEPNPTPMVPHKKDPAPASRQAMTVKDVGINDVVCCKRGSYRNHQGNLSYVEMCKQMNARLRKSPKEDSARLAEKIIASIAGMTPPGRVLQRISENKFELADDHWVKQKVKKGITESSRSKKNNEEKNGVYGCKVEPDPTPMVPHEKDPAPVYIEERAYLFHDPPMPDTGIRTKERAVSADDLPPLPAAPPLVIPTKTECKWTFNEESRVLLVNFNGIDRVSTGDKRAFAEMLQRDDITVVAEGLLEGINPKLLSLDYMAVTVKDHHRFRRYKRDSSGDYVTYEEKKGHLSMKLSDFIEYLKQRKKALTSSGSGKTETAFSFLDRELKEVNVDVTDPIYLIDMDMPNRLPHVFAKFNQAVKIPELLPGGEWCMTNEVL
jgi:hypothetical protein